MDSFYDTSYDMVPFDERNAAVDQLAVNTTGDVTVEGGLNVNGNVVVSKQLHITSDGNTSQLCMHGSGNPDISHPFDVDIAVSGGTPGSANAGHITVAAGGGITLYSGSNPVEIDGQSTVLKNNLYIDSPGANSSSINLYGALDMTGTNPSAVQLSASGGTTTANQGNLDVYAQKTTVHGNFSIDPLLGNLYIAGTAPGNVNQSSMLRFYSDSGSMKLALQWAGNWYWFTPSSSSPV